MVDLVKYIILSGATSVVINVKTGEILAMASVYSFYHNWEDSESFTNYAIQLWKSSRNHSISMSEISYEGDVLIDAMIEVAKIGDIFCTVTGCKDVIVKEHYEVMKDKAVLCNAGHFDCEVNVHDLEQVAVSHERVRQNIEGYTMADGRKLYVLAEGRLVNLAAGDGHPAEIMDLSFAMQALAAEHVLNNGKNMEPKVYVLPRELDEEVAKIKLHSMGYDLDALTQDQIDYLTKVN